MLKLKHSHLIILAGVLWLGIGTFLLGVGLRLLASQTLMADSHTPLIHSLAPFVGGVEQAVLSLIIASLALGFIKGRVVLAKSAKRVISRIKTLSDPLPIHRIYAPKFYLLIGSMIALGMLLRVFGTPIDVRGVIDVAIGSALLQGSRLYFRQRKPLAE